MPPCITTLILWCSNWPLFIDNKARPSTSSIIYFLNSVQTANSSQNNKCDMGTFSPLFA